MEEPGFYFAFPPGPEGQKEIEKTLAALARLEKAVNTLENSIGRFNRTRCFGLSAEALGTLRRQLTAGRKELLSLWKKAPH